MKRKNARPRKPVSVRLSIAPRQRPHSTPKGGKGYRRPGNKQLGKEAAAQGFAEEDYEEQRAPKASSFF